MTSLEQAELLIALGALGILQFGALFVACRFVRSNASSKVGGDDLVSMLCRSRWQRVIRSPRFAPPLLAISLAALIAGLVLRTSTT